MPAGMADEAAGRGEDARDRANELWQLTAPLGPEVTDLVEPPSLVQVKAAGPVAPSGGGAGRPELPG